MNRLLLDTNVLIWWLDDSPRLSLQAREAIAAGEMAVFVSAASLWEIEIKRATGRLQAPEELEAAVSADGFVELPMTFRHTITAGRLPRLHGDPFDRMLVAQAMTEGLILVTADHLLSQYGVPVLAANR